ncbi:unnamed protein product [Effrenium voratum]|nr:unnamed protein product [Effrenium voratum]
MPRSVRGLQSKVVRSVSCGEHHVGAVSDLGVLYTWGRGQNGRLGHGGEENELLPKAVEVLSGHSVGLVACGEFHTGCILQNAPHVYTWGLGLSGRLGHGDESDRFSPTFVEALTGMQVTTLACGGHHTAAVDHWQVMTWGGGAFGKLGHGNRLAQTAPKVVIALQGRRVVQVSLGPHHSAALTQKGEVFTWGQAGRLGHASQGAEVDEMLPRQVAALSHLAVAQLGCGHSHCVAVTESGDVWAWGSSRTFGHTEQSAYPNVPTMIKVLTGKAIVSVACGVTHNIALSDYRRLASKGRKDRPEDERPRDKKERQLPTASLDEAIRALPLDTEGSPKANASEREVAFLSSELKGYQEQTLRLAKLLQETRTKLETLQNENSFLKSELEVMHQCSNDSDERLDTLRRHFNERLREMERRYNDKERAWRETFTRLKTHLGVGGVEPPAEEELQLEEEADAVEPPPVQEVAAAAPGLAAAARPSEPEPAVPGQPRASRAGLGFFTELGVSRLLGYPSWPAEMKSPGSPVAVNNITAYGDIRKELASEGLYAEIWLLPGDGGSDSSMASSPVREALRRRREQQASQASNASSDSGSPQHSGTRSPAPPSDKDKVQLRNVAMSSASTALPVGNKVTVKNTFIEVPEDTQMEEDLAARFSRSDPTPVMGLQRLMQQEDSSGASASLPIGRCQGQGVVGVSLSKMVSPFHMTRRQLQQPPRFCAGPGAGVAVLAMAAIDEDLDLEELEEEVDEEMQKLRQRLELQPAPKRLPSTKNVPFIGHKRAPTDEQLEAMIEQEVPENRRNTGRFDPHYDNPLTKGVEIMTKAGKHLEHLVCCRGCGVPLQTHDPDNVGYVRFAKYLDKWASRLHRKLLCSRCLQLEKGSLVPVVKETLAEGQVGFGGQVVPADVLAAQLATIRKRRCLVVYVVDVLDFNGSFIRKIREIVGKNPVIIVGTKIDLLPPRTNMDLVKNWLLYILRKKKLRALEVQLVSNETGKGINYAVNAIIEHRSGMDVFVVGAANAGKSAFIRRLLDRLEVKFPQGKVENCERPLVSRTPGTTLGLIQMRAFRRSATSPVFAALYDTPGVHQPNSLQNLLDIERYNYVQPTRSFEVHTVTPAKDVLSELKASGEAVSQENLQQWLGRSVRYLWGFPGQDPVLAVEVVRCQANVPGAAENGRGYPDPPEDMELAQICRAAKEGVLCVDEDPSFRQTTIDKPRLGYVKTPDKLSLDGKVMADLSLTGFGWVAVSFAALSAQAAGRPMDRSKVTIRVYGPQRLKVVENEFPVPVAGLPGTVPAPPEEELMGEARAGRPSISA